jgi:hypothetical protein
VKEPKGNWSTNYGKGKDSDLNDEQSIVECEVPIIGKNVISVVRGVVIGKKHDLDLIANLILVPNVLGQIEAMVARDSNTLIAPRNPVSARWLQPFVADNMRFDSCSWLEAAYLLHAVEFLPCEHGTGASKEQRWNENE